MLYVFVTSRKQGIIIRNMEGDEKMSTPHDFPHEVRALSYGFNEIIHAEPAIISMTSTTYSDNDTGSYLEWHESRKGPLKVDGYGISNESLKHKCREHNYTEMFDLTVHVGRSWRPDKPLNGKVQDGMRNIARRMNHALIYGIKKDSCKDQPSRMGGLLQFLSQPGCHQFNANGKPITANFLNNVMSKIKYVGGAYCLNVACNKNQKKKIIKCLEEDDMVGYCGRPSALEYEFVDKYPGGIIDSITVDNNFPVDKIAIIDTILFDIAFKTWRQLHVEDATMIGSRHATIRLVGEYTLVMRNAKEVHGLITNLEV